MRQHLRQSFASHDRRRCLTGSFADPKFHTRSTESKCRLLPVCWKWGVLLQAFEAFPFGVFWGREADRRSRNGPYADVVTRWQESTDSVTRESGVGESLSAESRNPDFLTFPALVRAQEVGPFSVRIQIFLTLRRSFWLSCGVLLIRATV